MEKEWNQLKKHQDSERKLQAKFSKYRRFRDVDPRPLIRPFNEKMFIKGIFNWIKFIVYETLFSIFSILKGKKCELKKPVFIIGLPHSGTSIFMKMFALHPDITNASELNTYWHPCNYLNLTETNHYKDEKDCNEQNKNRLKIRLCFENLIRGNRRRFLNKNPNNTVTARYIRACFPDAFIIHIIRDGRAVVNSLINSMPPVEKYDRYKEPDKRINPFPGVKPKNWRELIDKNPVLQHAKQWKSCINLINEQSKLLKPGFMEIRYEDLCENTRHVIEKVWKFSELNINKNIMLKVPEKLDDRNYKYKKYFTKKDIELIESIIKPELVKYNFSDN